MNLNLSGEKYDSGITRFYVAPVAALRETAFPGLK
jgi:hypothetical protein